ncbi:MAG: haloacid dehalogenase type II [Planctomycetota bacterium]
MDLSRIQYLTFDCYGTLVDWESGILKAIRPVLSIHGVTSVSDEEIIADYARAERELESGEYMSYRDVLRGVMRGFGEKHNLKLESRELDRLPESIARWRPFAEVPGALASLAQSAGLVVTSNIDGDLFEASREVLTTQGQWDFEHVVTADYCRSYKPNPRHWKVALALLDTTPDRVLHVAESVYHDIEPAKALGFATVWVNRRGVRGPGASGPGKGPAVADLEVRSLAELAMLFTTR